MVSLRISLHLAPGPATLNGAYILNNDGAATGFAVCRTEILLRRLARAAAGLQIIGPSRVGDLGFGADRSRRALRLGLDFVLAGSARRRAGEHHDRDGHQHGDREHQAPQTDVQARAAPAEPGDQRLFKRFRGLESSRGEARPGRDTSADRQPKR